MFPNAIKSLVLLVACCIVAISLGNLIGQGDYESLLLLSYATIAFFILLAPGYLPLLALGLLNPFVLPIPYIYRFPFLAIMLVSCVVKLVFRNSLTHREFSGYKSCLNPGFLLFFAWVALRYLMKPVMPNLSGFGQGVTGFRSYMDYGFCFGILLLL